LGINKTVTTCTAGKLRLGYPELITPEEIPFLINVSTSSVPDFYLHLSILLVEV